MGKRPTCVIDRLEAAKASGLFAPHAFFQFL
jgi:hypothetical protein